MKFNELDVLTAGQLLEHCCGARRWWQGMLSQRPYASAQDILSASERAFDSLGEQDWLEAFAHHPQIGADLESLRKKFASTAELAASEQAGAQTADETILRELAAANQLYRQQNGFIFIICASGLSGAAMLTSLRERLKHSRAKEIGIAAAEQRKITRLRLEKTLLT